MTIAIIDKSTVLQFVEDGKKFDHCVSKCFEALDADQDGMLSRVELGEGLCNVFSLGCEKEEIDDIYHAIFERFDKDRDGSFNRDEFRSLMKEIMFAMARGLGNSLVLMALCDDSLLMKAVQHESSRNM